MQKVMVSHAGGETAQTISASNYFGLLPTPKIPHMVLEGFLRPRTIVVGDIHGCYDEFLEILGKCNYSADTSQVVLLGDLVNKGPASAEVVRFARKHGFYCIRGNHEQDALVYALNIHGSAADRPQYLSYLDQLEEADIEWLKELPYSITVPSLNLGFVHAGLVANISLHDQGYQDLVTIRNVVKVGDKLVGSSKDDVGVAWIEVYRGDPLPFVYFGHDAKRGIQLTEYAHGLDSGCVYGE